MEGGGFTAKRLHVDVLESIKSGGLAVPPDLQMHMGSPWNENSRCTATSCGNHATDSGVLARLGSGQHGSVRMCRRSSGRCLASLNMKFSNTSGLNMCFLIGWLKGQI